MHFFRYIILFFHTETLDVENMKQSFQNQSAYYTFFYSNIKTHIYREVQPKSEQTII